MKPVKYDEVSKIMDTLVYNISYSPTLFEPSIAYTTARMNDLYGDIYKIFVNNQDKELAQFLFMHECGHIIYTHCKNMNLRMNTFLEAKIAAAYQRVSHLFPSKKSFLELFTNMLFNVVMDFEVNSRLFTQQEWDFMQERLKILLNDSTSQGMWPIDYGFKPGLTWNEYLNLILINPEEFLCRFRFIKSKKKQGKNSKDGGSDAGGTTKTKGGGNKKSSEFDGTLSGEEYKKFKESIGQQKMTNKEFENLSKIAADHKSATFSIPTGQPGHSNKSSKPVTINFRDFNSRSDLLTQIERLLHVKVLVNSRRDIMYNANRRKMNTNVIIPKIVREEVHRMARLYLLIDVSGSVDPELVYDFISTFQQVSNNFKKTRVITWATDLIDDWDIKDPIPNHYGGGTCISKGIDYIQKKYSPMEKDVLFVISDFEDYLENWSTSLSTMKCHKYAINWDPELTKNKFNPGFASILNGKLEK